MSGAAARRRGDQRDVKVRKVLEDEGFGVGSRRKIPGPGDLLAVRPIIGAKYSIHDVLLIEVKSTAGGAWERFNGQERLELFAAATVMGAIPVMAWWPPNKSLVWFRGDVAVPFSPWPRCPAIPCSLGSTDSTPSGVVPVRAQVGDGAMTP